MSIREKVHAHIGETPSFKCVGCGHSVEEERLSYPVCGWCLREQR